LYIALNGPTATVKSNEAAESALSRPCNVASGTEQAEVGRDTRRNTQMRSCIMLFFALQKLSESRPTFLVVLDFGKNISGGNF